MFDIYYEVNYLAKLAMIKILLKQMLKLFYNQKTNLI